MSRPVKRTYKTDISGLRTKEAEQFGIMVCVESDVLKACGKAKIIDQNTVEVTFLPEWKNTLPDLDMELLAIAQELPGGEMLLLGFNLRMKQKVN